MNIKNLGTLRWKRTDEAGQPIVSIIPLRSVGELNAEEELLSATGPESERVKKMHVLLSFSTPRLLSFITEQIFEGPSAIVLYPENNKFEIRLQFEPFQKLPTFPDMQWDSQTLYVYPQKGICTHTFIRPYLEYVDTHPPALPHLHLEALMDLFKILDLGETASFTVDLRRSTNDESLDITLELDGARTDLYNSEIRNDAEGLKRYFEPFLS
jgi:hypothetical protein